MSDDPTSRTPASPAHAPASAGAKEGPRTVISKRPIPAPEPVAPVRNPIEELGQSLVGVRLGHFVLETFIGGGGMGAVFRGTDETLDRTVAIKILSKDRTDEDTVRRFQNEAQSAARLDHPNIARVYYVGEDRGWNYIVFEYIEGRNLRDLVEQRGPLPLDEALSYTLQVAEALDHASRRDVVHRDIKPSNVLVMPDGRVKLVDMGLARLHQVEASNADLTATGVTLGTFDYISPEQARDPRSADVRSDLYSLGCTLFYMLTGQPPFPGGTVLQKLLSHSSDPPPDIRAFRPDTGEETSVLLERLLAKQPAHRYQTPSELIGAILLLADELGLESLGSSQEMVVASDARAAFWRQIPWAAPIALLLAAAVVLQFVWSDSSNAGAERMRPRFTSPTEVADRGAGGSTPGDGAADSPAGRATPGDDEGGRDGAGTATTPAKTNTEAASGDDSPSSGAKPTGGATSGKPNETEAESSGATPPATGAAPSGSTGGPAAVVGPLKRIIVAPTPLGERPDGASRVVDSLADAFELAQEETTVETIECRWQGELATEDLDLGLSGRRLALRAATGCQPTIAYRPTAGETSRDRRMVRLTQANLSFDGVNVLFALPEEPYDDWAIFSCDRASSLEFEDCVLTVRNSGRNGTPLNRVACVEWSKSLAPEMASMERPLRTGPPPLIGLRNVIVRGQATLVRATDGIPFRLAWNQGLFASTESLVTARGAIEQPAVTDGLQLELQNVTLALGGAVCRMMMDAEHRFPWTCVGRVNNSILVRAGEASGDSRPIVLVEQEFAAGVEPIRKRPFLSGAGNFYPSDLILFRVDAIGATQDSVEYTLLDRDRARDEKWYDEQPTLGMVMWSNLSQARPVDARTQHDYVLDDTPQNPARTAGFDPSVLPTLVPDGAARESDPSNEDSSTP